MDAEVGDKVRVKDKGWPGARGIVEALGGGHLLVRLEDTQERLKLLPEEVVNLSLAARKAWVSRPNRRVGRPKGLRLSDRVSVTLRIDREVWGWFQQMEDAGLITDRTGTVNRWFREKLADMGAFFEEGEAECPSA
jgi:hypothetical protein